MCLLLNIYKLQTQSRSDSKGKLTIWSKERKRKVIFLASNTVTRGKDWFLSWCSYWIPLNHDLKWSLCNFISISDCRGYKRLNTMQGKSEK